MPTVLLMGILIVIAIGAAELVRLQCRRMLTTPRRRPVSARPVRSRSNLAPSRGPIRGTVAATEKPTLGYATASATAA